MDENDEIFSTPADKKLGYGEPPDFTDMVLQDLRKADVRQTHKEDRIAFTALMPLPGHHVCAEGRYVEGCGEAGAAERPPPCEFPRTADSVPVAAEGERGLAPGQAGLPARRAIFLVVVDRAPAYSRALLTPPDTS